MKLLQLNAWGGRLEPQIGDLLQAEQPDILCLQEAISFSDAKSGLFITTETIQQNYNLAHEAFSPVFSFNYMKGLAKFGNGILSRYPILKSETVFTHEAYKENFAWKEDGANMRNFVHATLNINDSPCHVLTHHGFWIPDHKNGNHETKRQMQILADYIKPLEGPIILTGDFNLIPGSESMNVFDGQLRNLTREYALHTTRTNLTFKTEACDYILVNDAVEVKDFYSLDKIASDHKALVFEFEV